MRIIETISAHVRGSVLEQKIQKLETKYYAKVYFPEELSQGFDDLIGMKNEKENLKDALNFLLNMDLYLDESVLRPTTRYLLAGAPGSGKTPLIKALAKESGIPLIVIDVSAFNAFPKRVVEIVDLIFSISDTLPACILNFENFTASENLPSEPQMLFHHHLSTKIKGSENTVVFLSTASSTIQLPPFYFAENLFNLNKVIPIMPPTLETRKELFAKYLAEFNIELDDAMLERLSRNTMGMYPKDIEFIVKETLNRVARQGSLEVSFKDFHETILQMAAGEEYNKLSEKERESTAYHEAGHVIAAYYTNPEYILGRVEITPRAQSLGLTFEEAGEEKYCKFRHEIEYDIIYSLGGMAAEKLIYGETTSGVTSDLAAANSDATLMVQAFGMDEDFGPIVLDDDVGFASEKFYAASEELVQKILKDLFAKTYQVVSEHRKQLEALASALLENEVLIGDEIKHVLDAAEKE